MAKPLIFVSCGQRTQEEKELGHAICELIGNSVTFEFFYAERAHTLRGLHENILGALARAAAFVTVLHPRGTLPYSVPLTRASVWVEQEIAIAAYIQLVTNRPLQIAAYVQKGVGREGLRELLHLNPYEFETNAEILVHFEHVVKDWVELGLETSQSDIQIDLQKRREVNGFNLQVRVTNQGARADKYSCSIEIPAALVNESNVWVEVRPAHRHGYRRFEVTERGAVHDTTGQFQGPITEGSSKDFFGLSVALIQIPKGNRAELLKNPIYITAELDGRLGEKTIPVETIFDLGDLDY